MDVPVKQRSRGFTLVELLAAVVIVTVLAALVSASVGVVRENAMRAKNVANLKQLISGWHLYAADNSGYFPLGLSWEASSIQNPPNLSILSYRYWWRWYGGIAGYMPTLVVSDTEAANKYGGPNAPTWYTVYDGWFPPNRLEEIRSMEKNAVGYHFNRRVGFNRRIFIGDIKNAARTPVLFAYWDEDNPEKPLGQYFSSPLASDGVQSSFMRAATKAMGDGNHFAFADGHIEWVPAKEDPKEYEEQMEWIP